MQPTPKRFHPIQFQYYSTGSYGVGTQRRLHQGLSSKGLEKSTPEHKAGMEPPTHAGGQHCTAFSPKAFMWHLVNFVIADDQVSKLYHHLLLSLTSVWSLNVVECPEFCQLLLLLQESLEDKDIPHWTKFHKLIIDTWIAHFAVLKKELAVCFFNYLHCIYLWVCTILGGAQKNILHCQHLV